MTIRPAKILIAEDTPDLLELMKDRLVFEGYEVITARDGKEAWTLLQKQDPDVILLDLMMPKMDGYQVLVKLREQAPGSKYKPVIIVSAKGEFDDMRKGFQLEADHYIVKPVDMKDVLSGIKKMLRLVQSRKTAEEIEQELD